MKSCYALFAFIFFILSQTIQAQCPPPGFPQPGNTCPQAPILCPDLDGYCATINNNNTTQNFPGCPGWQLNNDEWFAFFAGTTSITIQVTPSNCSPGGMQGLQGGIYQACGPPWVAMDLQCSCTTSPFTLSSNSFVVGQVYWIVLDGCSGNVCDYAIDVLSGSTVGVPPADPGPVTGPMEVCQGTSGSYSLAPVNAATTYTWTVVPPLGTVSGSGTNINVNWGNTPGNANLCVTTSNLCYANPTPSCIPVTVVPTPTATISGGGNICTGSSATVDLTVTFTGQGPWTFIYRINGVAQPPITTSSNPYILTVNQPGTYTLFSVNSVTGNCPGTVSGSSTVTQTTLTPTVTVTPASCGQSNGAINLTPSGGTPPYMFMWSNSQTTEDLNNIPAGSYTVTVTSSNGCSATLTATVPDNVVTLNVTGTVVANTTCNGSNGSIDVSVAPAGSYTYSWSPGGQTTQDLSNIPAGTYTVTVTSGLTCTGTASFTVPDNPNLPNLTPTTTGTTCDLSNGSINLAVSGGVPPFTFLWSPGGATTQNLTNIPAGSYSVTVTGANGCTNVASATVNNNNPPITASANITPNTTCNGNNNGSIDLSVAPAGSYTYNWSPGGQTTQDLSNIPPGSYSVTITGMGTCSTTGDFTVPNQPNEPNITPTVIPSTCDLSNGSINLSVSGGVAPYTYLWSPGGATTQNLTGIPAGPYSVTVTGANGCTDVADITVPNNNPPINISSIINPNTTCNGNNNGSINISVAPAGSYTYSWSPGGLTTQDLNNLPPGTYSVTVTAGGSCSQTADFTVPDLPNQPNITPTILPSTCDLNNGSINLTVSGGVSPYTYLWSPGGATTQNISGIPAGSYSVTVTGANGCTNTADIAVPNNNPPINLNANVIANTTCIGGNGSINLTVTPPGTYTYIWSNTLTTQDLNNLPPGNYDVTVSAGGSCSATDTYVVPDEPNEPNLFFTSNNASCGLSNGSINLSVSGGVAPYTYLWSSNQTTQDISGIPADVYIVTVTGANGCTSVDGVVIDNFEIPINLDANVTAQTSCLTNNGAITLQLTPSNLSILWWNNSTATTLNNLPPGDYAVTVSAGGTCTETATFTVYDETDYPILATDITSTTCHLSNGAIDLTVIGGATPYQYKWSNNAMTQDLANLPEGDYTVTVTSALGCSTEAFVSLPNNEIVISPNGVVSDNISCTAPNGFIDLDVDPPGNYMYTWSNGMTVPDLNNIAAGTYTVTVKLGTCIATASFDVLNAAAAPNLSVIAVPAICGLSNGATNATVSGASPPYNYQWSNSGTTEDLNNLPPGPYALTVTDFFGCSATTSVTVANNNIALNISGVPSDNTSCVAVNGAVNITVSPAGAYTYNWSNSGGTEDLNNLPAGAYTVTVSAGNSCSATATFSVANNTPNPNITSAVTAAICSNSNGAIDLTVGGANPPYTFNWLNNGTNEDLSAIGPGTYLVTVTAGNGCTSDTAIVVPNNSSTFSLSGTIAPLTNCLTNNGSIDLTVTPAGPYTYLWSNTAATQDLASLPAGTYTVSVTETGSCTASISFIIPDDRTSPTTAQIIAPEICGLANGSIDLTVNGGTPPYVFMWASGQLTEDLNGITDGNYAVTITDANNCTTTASAGVPDNSVSFSVAGIAAPNTSCITDNGSVDLTLTPASPGSGLSYTFLWSNTETSEDLNGIAPATYTVTVSAGGTCTNTATFTIGNTAQAPSIAESVSAAFCGQSSGSIDLTVSGGLAPYTFLWSNNAVSEDLNTLLSGNYDVTVSDASGCTVTEAYAVPENVTIPSISGIPTANTSCVVSNGGIDINVSPALVYTFDWSNDQTTEDLAGIVAGSYSVTVSGGGSCTSVASFVVPNDAASVAVNGATSDVLCFGATTGAIDLTAMSSAPPYSFNWSPAAPGNPEDLSGLSSGSYTVTVTDALGCTGTAAFVVGQPAQSVQIVCNQTNTVSSPGALDGAGTVAISGGVAPYDVVWSPGGSQSNVLPGNFALNNLAEGNYAVTVTDANGCPVNCNFSIGIIACATAVGTLSNSLLANCGQGCLTANYNALGQFLEPNDVLQFILHEGSGNQIVNEIARSSQPTFCFNPSLMTYGTTYYIAVAAGNNDGAGNVALGDFCTVLSFGTPLVFYENPVAAIATPAPLSCAVSQVSLTGSSSLPGSGFAWSTDDGILIGNPAQAQVDASDAGAYTLIVSVNGCSDTTAIQVDDISNQPVASILISPDDVLDCTIDEIVLSGISEGSVNANSVWISNGTTYSPGTVLQITDPGTYQFVILDTLTFCSDTAVVLIDENLAYPPLFLDTPGLLTCTITAVTLSGGSPIAGVQFSWASINGADTTILGSGANFVVSTPGVYYLIGIDPVNQCTNALSEIVDADVTPPVADAGTPFNIDCFGETANLDGSGSSGATTLNFLWTSSDGHLASGINTATPQIDEPGTYSLLVTNPGNGCTDLDLVVIAPNAPLVATTVHQPPCYGDKGAIQIDSVTGGKPPVMYSIDNGQNFSAQNIFTNLDPGVYSLIVQDAEGCSATVAFTLDEADEFVIDVEPQVLLKWGDSYQIITEVSIPLSEIAEVLWTPGTGLSCDDCLDPLATPLNTTLYQVTVKSAAGCEDRAPIQFIVDKRVDVYVPNVFSPNNDGINDIFTVFADPVRVPRIKSLLVFTRWGELIYEQYDFEPNNLVLGWDGRYRNQEMNPAVFVWYAVLEFLDGSENLYKGDVTLER